MIQIDNNLKWQRDKGSPHQPAYRTRNGAYSLRRYAVSGRTFWTLCEINFRVHPSFWGSAKSYVDDDTGETVKIAGGWSKLHCCETEPSQHLGRWFDMPDPVNAKQHATNILRDHLTKYGKPSEPENSRCDIRQ